MTKRALISVSDKAGIVEFAQELKKLGWDIISTGGTKVALDNAGVDTIAIDDVTGFPEMMDGRVKTLHPNIHGGLLARRDLDSHLQAAKDNNIELIDLVVVNLYPFKETILKPDVTYADAVENIDIGGPSMLRSAAKTLNKTQTSTKKVCQQLTQLLQLNNLTVKNCHSIISVMLMPLSVSSVISKTVQQLWLSNT